MEEATAEVLERSIAEIQRRILEKEKRKQMKSRKASKQPHYVSSYTDDYRERHCKDNFTVQKDRGRTRDRNAKGAYSRTLTVHIITTVEETNKAIEKFKYTSCVGFDLEGIYTLGRDGRLSLIQICDEKNVYLIDMVALDQKIPKSLAKWLRSDTCCKFIHDSRADQDALFHCHGIELGGIFDTTVADMVHRVHNQKQNRVNRLKGMASLANTIIDREDKYKVIFAVETNRAGKSIDLKDLQKEAKAKRNTIASDSEDEAKWGDPSAAIPYITGKRQNLKTDCFQQKQDTKAMMQQDPYLWARRPLPVNLLLYAAVDGWLSFVMGQFYRRKFKQWQIDKTLFVSLKWCRSTARKKVSRRGSARVSQDIVKLVRSSTKQLNPNTIPHIDGTKTRRKAKAQETVDVDVDNLMLMANAQDFVVEKLSGMGKVSKFKRAPENVRMLQKGVTDIYTFKYQKNEDYVDVGKLVYSRLVPLKLVDYISGF